MLAYLANTLIFIMVGVVIMEKALSEIDYKDGFLIIVDYLGICVIRYVSDCSASSTFRLRQGT